MLLHTLTIWFRLIHRLTRINFLTVISLEYRWSFWFVWNFSSLTCADRTRRCLDGGATSKTRHIKWGCNYSEATSPAREPSSSVVHHLWRQTTVPALSKDLIGSPLLFFPDTLARWGNTTARGRTLSDKRAVSRRNPGRLKSLREGSRWVMRGLV